MMKRNPSQFKIDTDVPTQEAVIAKAATAVMRGEYENPTHAAHTFLNDYYLYNVSAQCTDVEYDDKIKYLAKLIGARIRSA